MMFQGLGSQGGIITFGFFVFNIIEISEIIPIVVPIPDISPTSEELRINTLVILFNSISELIAKPTFTTKKELSSVVERYQSPINDIKTRLDNLEKRILNISRRRN